MSQPLVEFVRDALLRGVPRSKMVQALETAGWSAKEIQGALDAFVETDLPVPVPRKRVSTSPRDAFFLLMMFSTLYTSAFALGSMSFNLIDLAMPLPGEPAAWRIQSLRFGIASVIVAFPVFLMMSALIAREGARNPGQKVSPIRRWLTYLTLFVAATALVCDLITLVVTFLEGDLTLRFGLKAGVVGLIAGSAFLHYLRGLRRDEMAPSAAGAVGSRAARTLALGGLVAVVLAVLACGLWFAGSPMRARLLGQDRQRVQDLIAIHTRVERHYREKGVLPDSLGACDLNPATFIEHKTDRLSGEPYLYRIVDATHFEVGATFALASAASEPGRAASLPPAGPESEGFWRHGPGSATFRVDAARNRP